MSRTYSTYLSDFQTITKDNSTANQNLGTTLINDSIKTICNLQGGKLRFLEQSYDILSVANQESYPIPNYIRKVIDIYVKIGFDPLAVIYMPEMVFDPTKWKLILAYRLGYNDFPYFTYVENQTLKLQPIPSSSNHLIHIRGRLNIKNLSIADITNTVTAIPYQPTLTVAPIIGAVSATLSSTFPYTTGTYNVIFSDGEAVQATLTNGSTAVTWTTPLTGQNPTTGAITTLTTTITVQIVGQGDIVTFGSATITNDMVGRYLQITETNANGGGDGFWYQIGGVINTTTVWLTKPYQGTVLSSATASCTIGQLSVIPEAYAVGVLWRSLAVYYQQNKDLVTAKSYWMMYDGGYEAGYQDKQVGGLMQQMLDNEGETEEGAYIPPFGSSSASIMQAPYYFPYQLAQGFGL